MNPNSCYKMINVVEGTDYTPTEQFTTHVDPNLGETSPAGPTVSAGLNSPIFALLCTASTGSGNVEIQALGNDTPVVFPSNAFIKGVVYYIYLKKLVSDDGGAVSFVGFQYNAYPFIL